MKKSNPNQYTLFGGDYALKGVECRICLKEAETLYSSEPICSTSIARRVVLEELRTFDVEHFACICLDTDKNPLNFCIVAKGAVDTVCFDVRSLIKLVVLCNASALIIAHNHPCASPEPSEEDKVLTGKVKEIMAMVGVQLLDHVIVNYRGDTYSFCDEGLI